MKIVEGNGVGRVLRGGVGRGVQWALQALLHNLRRQKTQLCANGSTMQRRTTYTVRNFAQLEKL